MNKQTLRGKISKGCWKQIYKKIKVFTLQFASIFNNVSMKAF